MFDVRPRKLKCGTEAGRGLESPSPKSPILHCFGPSTAAESCPVGGEGKGMGQSEWKPLPGSSRGFQAQLA